MRCEGTNPDLSVNLDFTVRIQGTEHEDQDFNSLRKFDYGQKEKYFDILTCGELTHDLDHHGHIVVHFVVAQAQPFNSDLHEFSKMPSSFTLRFHFKA